LRRTALILKPATPESAMKDWRLELETQPIADLQSRIAFSIAEPPPGRPADDLPALLGPDESVLALFQVGWALLTQGLVREAEPCLLRAYELAIETSQAAVAVLSALQLAHLGSLRGDPEATKQWIELSLETARRAPEAEWASIWPRIHQAFLLLLDGRHGEARASFEHMARRLRDLPAFQSHRASVKAGLGLLDLAAGKHGRAAEYLATALAVPSALYGFAYVATQIGMARLAAQSADLATARARLAHALDYSAERQLLPEYVRAAIEAARIERDFGAATAILSTLKQAARLARIAELAPLAEAAEALAERLNH
jgi:hypothetical protein